MARTLRLVGVQLALAAMLLRALLPVGWMPNTAGVAGTPIVLCTVNGPVRLVIGKSGNPLEHQPGQGDSHGGDICPFAAAAHFATVTPAVTPALPLSIAYFDRSLRRVETVDPPERHEPQSPRAPPSLA